jgi:predicted HD phosphohydrolase
MHHSDKSAAFLAVVTITKIFSHQRCELYAVHFGADRQARAKVRLYQQIFDTLAPMARLKTSTSTVPDFVPTLGVL